MGVAERLRGIPEPAWGCGFLPRVLPAGQLGPESGRLGIGGPGSAPSGRSAPELGRGQREAGRSHVTPEVTLQTAAVET